MAAASRSAPEWWRDGGSVDDGGAEVELSLRLRTGSSSTARRSMTIFYNGRVVAVDVTELQVS
uniref:Tify domain-containing protein n=1 Tax=Aegilops tauschii subsp. strangulata TaxID=200361 RepID=A0A453BMS4_AEGTS